MGGSIARVSLVQANNGQLLSSLQLSDTTAPSTALSKDPFLVRSLAFSSNSRFLAASLNDVVQLWDLKKRQLKTVFQVSSSGSKHPGDVVNAICFLPSGDLICGDQSGIVRIWESNSGNCADMLMPDTRSNGYQSTSVNCMQLSPANPSHLSAGFSDGSLSCWDLGRADRTCRRLEHLHSSQRAELDSPDRGISAVAYSPKNYKLIATAGSDGKICLIDTFNMPLSSSNGTTGNNSKSITASITVGEAVRALAFSEDAVHTAVGTSSGKILIYDWRNSRSPVCSVDAHGPSAVNALAFQVSVVSVSFSKWIRIFN